MSKIELYRDDDISRFTDLLTFIRINELFVKYGRIHTCSMQMKDLWDSRGIFHLLNVLPNLEIGLHCWEHIDYSQLNYQEALDNIKQCLDYWNSSCIRGYGRARAIRTFYPPWNRVSINLERAVKDCGLSLDYRLGKTLNNPVSKDNVFSFHWWEFSGGLNLNILKDYLKC